MDKALIRVGRQTIALVGARRRSALGRNPTSRCVATKRRVWWRVPASNGQRYLRSVGTPVRGRGLYRQLSDFGCVSLPGDQIFISRIMVQPGIGTERQILLDYRCGSRASRHPRSRSPRHQTQDAQHSTTASRSLAPSNESCLQSLQPGRS